MKKFLFVICFAWAAVMPVMGQSWIQKSSFPGTSAMYDSQIYFSVANAIYVLDEADKTLWKYDPATDNWSQQNDFTGPQRNFGVTFTIGNKAYYGSGGDGSGGNLMNDFWEYTPSTDSWAAIDTLPQRCYQATAFSLGNKGYVTMGLTNMVTISNKLWEYDPSTANWTQKNNIPFTLRYSGNGLSAGTSGFIGLGYSGTLNTWFDDLYEYDPFSDSWATLNPFPFGARCQATAIANNNIAYVGLGNLAMTQYSDVYSVDIGTGFWSTLPSLPGGGRINAAGYVINNFLYMGLGTGSSSMNDLWAYDISSGVPQIEDANTFHWFASADEMVTLVFNGPMPEYVDIYDITGRLVVKELMVNSREVPIRLHANGTYLVRYTLNEKAYVQKIVL